MPMHAAGDGDGRAAAPHPTRSPPHPSPPSAPQLKHDIRALAVQGDRTFAAVRGAIVECKRLHRSGEYRGHDGDVIQLLVLGDILLSLGADRRLLAWRIGDYSGPEVEVRLPEGFTPTCMAHPDTYLNKVAQEGDGRGGERGAGEVTGQWHGRQQQAASRRALHSCSSCSLPFLRLNLLPPPSPLPPPPQQQVVVGSEEGPLALYNFSSGRQLFSFPGYGSGVRCLAPSPALDVIGLGLADG